MGCPSVSKEERYIKRIDWAIDRQLFWTGMLLASGLGVIELIQHIEFTIISLPFWILHFALFVAMGYSGRQISKYMHTIISCRYHLHKEYKWDYGRAGLSIFTRNCIAKNENGNFVIKKRCLHLFYIVLIVTAIALLLPKVLC